VIARLLLLAALVLPACGRKNIPVAPQLVRPEPPEALSAIATPDGVRLTWLRPMRYSGGQRMDDLEGFVIERVVPVEAAPAEFRRIGALELEDRTRFRKERRLEWLDKDVRPGERYVYRVIAYTLDGYRSAPAGPVAVQYGPAGSSPPASPR